MSASKSFLERVYSASTPTESQALYDEWAKNYNAHVGELDYLSPKESVKALKYLDHSRIGHPLKVLDAGCGTGLVGVGLTAAVKQGELGDIKELVIDGLDLSEGMREVARSTGVYASLQEADLDQPLKIESESYDVVMCVGTLTKGHVGPKVLNEFVRVVKRGGGLVIATVLSEIWESGGFKAIVDDPLEKLGRVEVLSTAEFETMKGTRNGRMLVMRRKYLAEEIAHAGIGA